MNAHAFTQTAFRASKLAIATFLFCAVTAIASPAQTFTSLFSFDGFHGSYPGTPLVQGLDGAMYGTTPGQIYRITAEGQVGLVEKNLLSPNALFLATNGDFYGTTIDYATGTVNAGADPRSQAASLAW